MAKRGRPPGSGKKRAKLEVTPQSIQEMMDKFAQLHPKAFKQANKKMFRDCATLLKTVTRRVIKANLKNATSLPKRTFYREAQEAPIDAPWIKYKDYYGLVGIYGNDQIITMIHNAGAQNRKTQGWYESRWSTKTERRIKKPANRGSIPAQRFLEIAVERCNGDIQRIQESSLLKSVTRQWAKRS